MDLATYFERQKPMPGIVGIEKITFCYSAFTLVLALFFYHQIDKGPSLILYRLLFAGITVLLWQFYKKFPCQITYAIRVFFQFSLLTYWYPDIYNFAKLMPNMDPLFAQMDQILFGCQPAIEFSKILSGRFWSELFYMGYFSYYILIIAIILWAFLKHPRRFDIITNIVLCSFLLYFFTFLFLQSAGPQFYYQRIGLENASAGIFPPVHDWFRYHSQLIHDHVSSGLFCSLVEDAQKSEFPIAAFPSSHVGIATIIMILAHRMSKKLALVFSPFYIILCLSTVYIGAHYAVDVFGGWITAWIFIRISNKIYRTKFIHRPKEFDSLHRYGHHHHHSSHSQVIEK
jgi:membrane-associated phospholipid phosphatase